MRAELPSRVASKTRRSVVPVARVTCPLTLMCACSYLIRRSVFLERNDLPRPSRKIASRTEVFPDPFAPQIRVRPRPSCREACSRQRTFVRLSSVRLIAKSWAEGDALGSRLAARRARARIAAGRTAAYGACSNDRLLTGYRVFHVELARSAYAIKTLPLEGSLVTSRGACVGFEQSGI
jgi:hypothetical protein